MGLLDQLNQKWADFQSYREANTPRTTRQPVNPSQVVYNGLLKQPVENVQANAQGLLSEIKQAPADMRQLVSPGFAAQVQQQMRQPAEIDRAKGEALAMDLLQTTPMGGMVGAIKAFHGSPHKFEQFDMSKLGTGEGAQAYGHGLYFADSPAVAKSYQDLAKRAGPQVDGASLNRMTSGFEESALANMYQNRLAAGLSPSNAAEQTAKWGANHPQIGKEAADSFTKRLSPPPEGNLYDVNLRWPDAAREASDPLGPQHFLDWDKPLSQQGPGTREALAGIENKLPTIPDFDLRKWMDADPLASTWHNAINRDLGVSPDSLAATLKERGIPGIRYLDGMSRGAGEGSSNYVVFDDAIPEILKRNGLLTK